VRVGTEEDATAEACGLVGGEGGLEFGLLKGGGGGGIALRSCSSLLARGISSLACCTS
jgi:hypothetical protein